MTLKGKEAEELFESLNPHKSKLVLNRAKSVITESIMRIEYGEFFYQNKYSKHTWQGIINTNMN